MIQPVLVVLPDNVHYLAQTVGETLTLIQTGAGFLSRKTEQSLCSSVLILLLSQGWVG